MPKENSKKVVSGFVMCSICGEKIRKRATVNFNPVTSDGYIKDRLFNCPVCKCANRLDEDSFIYDHKAEFKKAFDNRLGKKENKNDGMD